MTLCVDAFLNFARILSSDPPLELSAYTRFGRETFGFSLQRSAEGWLSDFRPPSSPNVRRGAGSTLAILPSNTPAALLQITASAILAGARVALRPSHRDREFVTAWLAWLQCVAPDAAANLRIDPEPEVGDFEKLVVYGSDETVDLLAARFGHPKQYRGYGSRFSVACIDRSDFNTAAAIADDVVIWDQMGCLSIQTVYLVGALADGKKFGAHLAQCLEEREERFPRVAPPPNVSLEIRIHCADTAARPNSAVFKPSGGTAWSVLVDETPDLELTPLHRTVRVKAVKQVENVVSALLPHESQIEAIGVALCAPAFTLLSTRFGSEPDRLITVGSLQAPSILRRHGGASPLCEWLLTFPGH